MQISECKNRSEENIIRMFDDAITNDSLNHSFIFSTNTLDDNIPEVNYLLCRLFEREDSDLVLNHPDFIFIDGWKDQIKKEDVLSAIRKLNIKPLDTLGVKVVWIKSIENSSPQSINSLLKMIEEPPNDTYFIITTNRLPSVLETIKSRSQIFRIKSSCQLEITSALKNAFPEVGAFHLRVAAYIYGNVKEATIAMEDGLVSKIDAFIRMIESFEINKNSIYSYFSEFSNWDEMYAPLRMMNAFIDDNILSFANENTVLDLHHDATDVDFQNLLMHIVEFSSYAKTKLNFKIQKEAFLVKMLESLNV